MAPNWSTCSTPGCTGKPVARGLCSTCYTRWYRNTPDGAVVVKRLQQKRVATTSTERADYNKLVAAQTAWQFNPEQPEAVNEDLLSPEQRFVRAKTCYNNAVGVEARLFWKKVTLELHRLVQQGSKGK